MNETVAQTNWMPLIVLAAIVLAVAWHRGLLKWPTVAPVKSEVVHTSTGGITWMSSHELGVRFAEAKKREAEAETAAEFAKQAGDSLMAAFKAPFVSAAPAPASPQSPAPGV